MTSDFKATKQLFDLPKGLIYLDGNSLGPLPKAATERMANVLKEEWGQLLITGWNKAGWMEQPKSIGNRIARLIGAEKDHVVVGDTLSIKVFQALAAALNLRPNRRVILSDSGNFPSDLYMAQGLLDLMSEDYELRVVAPEELSEQITDEIAVTLITEVDYRTGRRHDMQKLTAMAHGVGALTVWDLAHSAGAIDVELSSAQADFAVGCTYKYLNGGPGAPAFIYVNPRHADTVKPALRGWLGHAAPFAFEQTYRAGETIERMRIGTPAVLASASLEAALDIWERVDMRDVRAKSIQLSQQFIERLSQSCPMLRLGSPKDPGERGSQVSFHFQDGYAAIQALIAHGVIGDFRAPDMMRFGFTPLFIDEDDVTKACAIIENVMQNELWDRDEYKVKSRVT